jgi:hypothetical protein
MLGHDDVCPGLDAVLVAEIFERVDDPLPRPVLVQQRPAMTARERDEMGVIRLVVDLAALANLSHR